MDELTSLNLIQKIAVMALPLVFAIVLHEVAHGWVANKLGDHTARDMGRLTLNPIPHIDLFGTIIMPLLLLLFTGGKLVFGYAKPVPINPYNFREPKKGMALSSLAGPGINMTMAVSFAFLLRVVLPGVEGFIPKSAWGWLGLPMVLMLGYGSFPTDSRLRITVSSHTACSFSWPFSHSTFSAISSGRSCSRCSTSSSGRIFWQY
jgi:Zn-dependent protease